MALLLASAGCGGSDAEGLPQSTTGAATGTDSIPAAGASANPSGAALVGSVMMTAARAGSTANAAGATGQAGQTGAAAGRRGDVVTAGSAASTTVSGAAGIGSSAAAGSGGAAGAGASLAGANASANAGTGGNSNAGSASSFQPCPADEDCRILPLGDSITFGIGFSGGYRVELFRKAHADGKRITFVGGSENGPNMVDNAPFPRKHEGHSGWTVSQIDGIVPDPALGPKPHIVLLHIGTNDVSRGENDAPAKLDTLIGQITKALPEALVVVASIIPLPNAANAVKTFNAEVPEMVEAHAAAGEHVMFVDQFKDFPTSELGDGVHPNEAGYARMAAVWDQAIHALLR